jgi:hypothetical protein
MAASHIPRRVQEKLGFYVYLYVDPRDDRPFYVGKGQGNRIYHHLNDTAETKKVQRIEELHQLGRQPRLEVLRYGLTESEAFLVESAAIDLLGVSELTNRLKGHGSLEGGRARLEDLVHELDAKDVEITDKVILINISQIYRYGMSETELYDATRGVWKIGNRCKNAEYAFCLYGGIVREVYSISAWVPAGSTMTWRDFSEKQYDMSKRLEFVGKIALEPVRKKYLGKSVRHYFSQGSQNPIKYVNC